MRELLLVAVGKVRCYNLYADLTDGVILRHRRLASHLQSTDGRFRIETVTDYSSIEHLVNGLPYLSSGAVVHPCRRRKGDAPAIVVKECGVFKGLCGALLRSEDRRRFFTRLSGSGLLRDTILFDDFD